MSDSVAMFSDETHKEWFWKRMMAQKKAKAAFRAFGPEGASSNQATIQFWENNGFEEIKCGGVAGLESTQLRYMQKSFNQLYNQRIDGMMKNINPPFFSKRNEK